MSNLWNLANQLTLFRLLAIPAILIAILYGRHGWALWLFLAAAVSDGIDGVVARRLNVKTALGAYLDPIADKLLLTSSLVVLSIIGSVPWWVTILAVTRDAIIIATVLVVTLATEIRRFPPSALGKLNTIVVGVAVPAVLLRNAYPGAATETLAEVLIWLTAAFTVLSGVHYAIALSRRLTQHAAGGCAT